ncbi:MAG: hypothetical protein NVSMB62_25820 [Acidobacteriaceae bacterium]
MDETKGENSLNFDVQSLVQQAVQEYMRQDTTRREPAYKVELQEERRRREQLERRMNLLVEENKKARQVAEEAERSSAIRTELQQNGVVKIDLAYKAVQDGVMRGEDGRLIAKTEQGEVPLREFITEFVAQNPEFLPARISGGSGVTGTNKVPVSSPGSIELEKIGPSMSKEDLERARQEILRVASQTLRGV